MKVENSQQGRSGFTLVEIMLVVAIIGMLAMLAIPALARARMRSQQTACINNLRQIEAAKAQWAMETKASASAVPTDADLFGVTNYIRRKPECPTQGNYSLEAVNLPPLCDQAGHALN